MTTLPPLPPGSLAARAREFSLKFTAWPSVTGTPDEARFATRLAELIRSLPCFATRPDDVVLAPIPDDPLGRANVIALARGRGSRTVLLAGHFDTVSVEDYGDLKHLAGQAEALRAGLVAKLSASGENDLASRDLESGEFLPGRGLLDMKSGVAAGLAVLEAFANDPKAEGNLVLVATPDEEDRSAGMRAAADLLPDFLARNRLDVALGINLDAICDNGDGTTGRVVTFGCIGKLLLSALVVGKEAHAAYPLSGVNAAYLAAELTAELEFAPELGEDGAGALASPPTVLGSRDLKGAYDVTIPGAVWSFWNVLVHERRAAEVIAIAVRLARRAADRAGDRMAERAARLRLPIDVTPDWRSIPVLTYAQVAQAACERDAGFSDRFAALAETLRTGVDLDLPTRSRRLFEEVWTASGLTGPAIVLGFGSMPYPAIHWPHEPEIEAAIRGAMAVTAERFGVSIGATPFFPAIADMSFLGPVDAADLAEAARQTPLWGSSIRWDLSKGPTPGFPLVNIGPWGRDYHHWLERVHAPYAFEVLPHLIQEAARRVLGGDTKLDSTS